jgi:tRNA-dihydrouridine synthase B
MIVRHCRMAVASDRYGNERQSIMAMRSRLMTYCKGFPGAKPLRQRLCLVSSLMEVEDLASEYLGEHPNSAAFDVSAEPTSIEAS